MKNFSPIYLALIVAAAWIGLAPVWAQPTTLPGAGVGVPLPLDTSSQAQSKAGSLTLSELCLVGDCRPDWPAVSAPQTQSLVLDQRQNFNCAPAFYTVSATIFLNYPGGIIPVPMSLKHCATGRRAFSISTPAVGGTIFAYDQPRLRCWLTASNYQIQSIPSTTFSYNPSSVWTDPLNLQISFDGSSFTATGECEVYGYTYPADVYTVAQLYIPLRYFP